MPLCALVLYEFGTPNKPLRIVSTNFTRFSLFYCQRTDYAWLLTGNFLPVHHPYKIFFRVFRAFRCSQNCFLHSILESRVFFYRRNIIYASAKLGAGFSLNARRFKILYRATDFINLIFSQCLPV